MFCIIFKYVSDRLFLRFDIRNTNGIFHFTCCGGYIVELYIILKNVVLQTSNFTKDFPVHTVAMKFTESCIFSQFRVKLQFNKKMPTDYSNQHKLQCLCVSEALVNYNWNAYLNKP